MDIFLLGYKDTPSNGTDMYLVKTDASGNEIWSQAFGGSGTEQAFSVQQTSDGGFILAGSRDNDVYLVKTDASGNGNMESNFWRKWEDGGRLFSKPLMADLF